jgi:stage II sporulation protein D
MQRLVLVTALLLPFAAPQVADAATVHEIRGAGWGHGIGLSQYGAYGLALNGRDYREILAHYYRGTDLAQASSRPVRVLLQPSDPYIRFRGATRAGGRRLKPSTTYVVRPAGGSLVLRTAAGRRVGRFSNPLVAYRPGGVLRLLGPALNGVRHGVYRGAIEVRLDGVRGVHAINSLPLDLYVQGVVAGEMPSSWHPEALKSQAVAARSYAIATDKPGPFDHYPDTRSQVYRGLAGETASSTAAVAATAGQVLTYDGAPAVTYFFSTSGGHTENVENVFLGSDPEPYLRGVPDPYDDGSPYHRWRLRMTTAQLNSRLRGYVFGRFRRLEVLKRGASPRVVTARVRSSFGTKLITGPTLRARLGLRDTWVRFTTVRTSTRRGRPARVSQHWPLLPAAADVLRAGVPGPTPLFLAGSFYPAPSERRLVVERRTRRGWQVTGRTGTDKSGRYRTRVRRRGTYRVRGGDVAGPAVRVKRPR